MVKKALLFFAFLFLAKFFFDYFRSAEFQNYGDKNKAQWTCHVNNLVGELYLIMSRYEEAYGYLKPIVARCPQSDLAEKAQFKMADCLEKQGRRFDAAEAYRLFAEQYPNSRYTKIAVRNFELLKSSR